MTPDGAALAADAFAPLTTQMLSVSDGHQLYVETVGRADGIPAVHLHGGPGSGTQPMHRRLFDPRRFRAVLFDQRGAGRSLPARERANNTTAHLIADMEAIREALGIERWLVVGGSWGSTLGLAYAQQHPHRVIGLVLRATFLGTRAELEWAFGGGLPSFPPGALRRFPQPAAARGAKQSARRLLPAHSRSRSRRSRSRRPRLGRYRTRPLRSRPRRHPARHGLDQRSASTRLPSTAFMEAYYFANNSFLAPDQLMANAGALMGIPGIIIQGRHDLLCPPSTAYALASVWTDAKIRVVERAGHSLSDPGIADAVTAAVASFT